MEKEGNKFWDLTKRGKTAKEWDENENLKILL